MKPTVRLGHITGVHGIRGWVKVFSDTRPREAITEYRQWQLRAVGAPDGGQVYAVEQGRAQGRTVIARLRGIDSREAAEPLIGREIFVPREALPACEEGEYYWADLEGLAVVTVTGEPLGEVDHLLETGAHDVLVLRGDGRRMIPFAAPDVIREVDIAGGRIVVDWLASYWE